MRYEAARGTKTARVKIVVTTRRAGDVVGDEVGRCPAIS